MNSFLLLFDNKLNSVTTGWDEQQGRKRIPGLGMKGEVWRACSALCSSVLSDPFGTPCHSDSLQSCRKGTNVINRENIPERWSCFKATGSFAAFERGSCLFYKDHGCHLVISPCCKRALAAPCDLWLLSQLSLQPVFSSSSLYQSRLKSLFSQNIPDHCPISKSVILGNNGKCGSLESIVWYSYHTDWS